jgi:hypothetical protein
MSISKIFELYARSGRSLIDNGLNEAVLPLSEARIALDLFDQQRWYVLGGDVYRLKYDNKFESTYENWSYDGKSEKESIVIARNFVDNLVGQSVYVVFVVDDQCS